MGRGKREERLPPFPSSHHPPRTFYFYDYCYFYWDTQRKPLRRRAREHQPPFLCKTCSLSTFKKSSCERRDSNNSDLIIFQPTSYSLSRTRGECNGYQQGIVDLCLKQLRKSQPISNRSSHFKPELDFLLENRKIIKQMDGINICKPCVGPQGMGCPTASRFWQSSVVIVEGKFDLQYACGLN